MVGDLLVVAGLEMQFRALLQLLEDEAYGHRDGVAHVGVVHAQQRRILVAQGHGAARRGGHHLEPAVHRLAQHSHVVLRVPRRLLRHPVGNQRDAAAFLLIQQLHAHPKGVEHPHQVLAQLRVIVVHVAAVEIGHLFGKCGLRLRLPLQPRLETLPAVAGEAPPVVDLQRGVHHGLGRTEAGHGVDDGREGTRHRAHQVGVGEDPVPQLGRGLVVADTRRLDQVGHVHPGGAGDLAALAVHAILEGIIEVLRILEAEPFPVRPGLLGAGIQGIHLQHGTINRAHGAFHALLEIMAADGILLHVHNQIISSTAANALRTASPAPLPNSGRVAPRMEPMA